MRIERIGDATLYLGDCMEILPQLGGVDAVVTDPPYGLGDRMRGGTWGATKAFQEMPIWDASPPPERDLITLINASKQAIFWGGQYFNLPPARCWLLWNKINAVPTMADFETAWTNLDRPSKRFDAPVGRVEFGHPTQKPLPLMEWTLGFVLKAKTILDPYMGSGTTGVACAKHAIKFIGVEIDPKYFEIACRRIDSAYREPGLFSAAPSARLEQEALF